MTARRSSRRAAALLALGAALAIGSGCGSGSESTPADARAAARRPVAAAHALAQRTGRDARRRWRRPKPPGRSSHTACPRSRARTNARRSRPRTKAPTDCTLPRLFGQGHSQRLTGPAASARRRLRRLCGAVLDGLEDDRSRAEGERGWRDSRELRARELAALHRVRLRRALRRLADRQEAPRQATRSSAARPRSVKALTQTEVDRLATAYSEDSGAPPPPPRREAGVVNAFVAAGAGFLLAVLWFDLMFDVQAAGRGGGEVPEPALASIAAYYARVTTAARPMNRLIAAVMVATLAAIVVQIARGSGPVWLGWVSLALALAAIGLAGLKTVPSAVAARHAPRPTGPAERPRTGGARTARVLLRGDRRCGRAATGRRLSHTLCHEKPAAGDARSHRRRALRPRRTCAGRAGSVRAGEPGRLRGARPKARLPDVELRRGGRAVHRLRRTRRGRLQQHGRPVGRLLEQSVPGRLRARLRRPAGNRPVHAGRRRRRLAAVRGRGAGDALRSPAGERPLLLRERARRARSTCPRRCGALRHI